MRILVINGGSSSFKFSLFDVQKQFDVFDNAVWKKTVEFKSMSVNRKESIESALSEVSGTIDVVGHRVVHGGDLFKNAVWIDRGVKEKIQKLSHLAPLHNPINLEGITIAEAFFPKAQHGAVFDTAFHSTMPEVAWTYPGPLRWREQGIRRYGFHGISHQYASEMIQRLLKKIPNKLITCHLGNGSSCAAIANGSVIDTTMGFTPMEGLMMGTRSGSIDPGILFYLVREKNYTMQQVEDCLNYESGLMGISGTFDMRQIIHRMKAGDRNATLAFDLYVYRLKQAVGSLTASMDGLDSLCFTGGIGSNAPEVRDFLCGGLNYFGISIDSTKNINIKCDGEISLDDSRVKVFVIDSKEDWMIAKECFILNSSESGV
jgi:acetate kinase